MTRRDDKDDKPAQGSATTPKVPVRERKDWDPANYGDPGEKVEKDDRASGRAPSPDD